jgi:hypothetical protein
MMLSEHVMGGPDANVVVVGKTFAKKGSWRRSEISMVNE